MGASIASIVHILLSIIYFIFKYLSRVKLKYFSAQIYIRYKQILSTSLLSLTCVLYSFLCLSLAILIIGKTNLSHNFLTK